MTSSVVVVVTNKIVRLFVVAIVLILSTKIAQHQMRSTQMLTGDRLNGPETRLENYLNGTVPRPFVYRVLVPSLLRTASSNWGSFDMVFEHAIRPLSSKILPPNFAAPKRLAPYALLYLVLTASAYFYAWFVGKAYAALFAVRAWGHQLPQLLALLVLIPFVEQGRGHVYDFTVLAVLAGLLYAVVASRWALYICIFLIGCFNKETVIFGSMLLLCAEWHHRASKRFKLFVLAQLAAFLVIQGSIRFAFENNSGATVEHYLRFHLDWLMHRNFVDLLSLGFILGFFVRGFRELPSVLRRMSVVLVPALLLYFAVGFPGEFRIFYDVVPLVVLIFARNLELGFARSLGLTPSVERMANAPQTGLH